MSGVQHDPEHEPEVDPEVGAVAVTAPTPGYVMNKDDFRRRLNRIEGQVRGLQRMIESDTYCIDVLTQVSATTRALQSVAMALLDEHVRHCVVGADPAESEAKIAEALRAIERLVKS